MCYGENFPILLHVSIPLPIFIIINLSRPNTNHSKNQAMHFDWAMKRLLRNKANFSMLERLLTTLLSERITIQKLLESESNQEDEYDKYNRVDILAKDSKSELTLIEVQNNSEYAYFQRMLFGASKLVTEYINRGKGYEDIRKVYSVNIVYFALEHGKDYVYHGKTEFRGIHTNDLLDTLPATEVQRRCSKPTVSRILHTESKRLQSGSHDSVGKMDSLPEYRRDTCHLHSSQLRGSPRTLATEQHDQRRAFCLLSALGQYRDSPKQYLYGTRRRQSGRTAKRIRTRTRARTNGNRSKPKRLGDSSRSHFAGHRTGLRRN